MKRFCFPLLLLLVPPLAAHGDTIYTAWVVFPSGAGQLTRFEGETPWLPESPFPPDPALPPYSLEFDPATHRLWGFDYFLCYVLCPPPLDPVLIDPLTGSSQFVHLPGLELEDLLGRDTDIHPLTRELRYFGESTGNFSYSFARLENRPDEPLSPPFHVDAVAHRPPLGSSPGVETYVIGRLAAPKRGSLGEPWFQLARIGGPGGDPPASSGLVTVIGPIDINAERLWFDISPNGTAYLAALVPFGSAGEENRLYRVDLGSGALEEIGIITPPSETAILSGIAVAPQGLGGGIVEVPALSPAGLVVLLLFLASVAIRRLRQLRSR